ncbi:MAG: hypothetical protein GXP06_13870 [Alphaproteobacteria bacterium]|nr:hypothetical protein [Alphaproteobacteria bacterium]
MYVDIDGDQVLSDPGTVLQQDAYYWIRVAERTLRILQLGDFIAPYGELAAFLETLPKPIPEGDALLNLLQSKGAVGEILADEIRKYGR